MFCISFWVTNKTGGAREGNAVMSSPLHQEITISRTKSLINTIEASYLFTLLAYKSTKKALILSSSGEAD